MDVRGGVEFSFMSTTLDREVALAYARRKSSGAQLVFEVQMGMIDRGADLTWLSQYEHEREILFAPLTGLEVQGTRVENGTLVVEVKLSVNLRSLTLEDVVAKMKHSHLQLIDMLIDELVFAGAPARALTPLRSVREEADRRANDHYNVAENFQAATNEALVAQRAVFDLLGDERYWRENDSGSSRRSSRATSGACSPTSRGRGDSCCSDSVVADDLCRRLQALGSAGVTRSTDFAREQAHRMRSTAALCARMMHHKTAISLLRLSLKRQELDDYRPKVSEAPPHFSGSTRTVQPLPTAHLTLAVLADLFPRSLASHVPTARRSKVRRGGALRLLCCGERPQRADGDAAAPGGRPVAARGADAHRGRDAAVARHAGQPD